MVKFILTLEVEVHYNPWVWTAQGGSSFWVYGSDEVRHSFIYEWPKCGSTFEFVDRTKSYDMTFQLKAT